MASTSPSTAFSPPRVISNTADGAFSVYAADVDGDGDTDVLSASENDDKIAWYENKIPNLPRITLAIAPSGVSEDGSGNLAYTFTRSGDRTAPLTVNFKVGGTAIFGDDYGQSGATSFSPTEGSITFAAGSDTATLTVDPSTDAAIEADETVALTLGVGAGYTISTQAPVTGTILNDDYTVLSLNDTIVVEGKDANALFTVSLSVPNDQEVQVNYTTVPVDATPNVDYTSRTGILIVPAHTSTATLSIPILNDNLNEPDEAFTVELSNPVNAIISPSAGIGEAIITDTLRSSLSRTLPSGVENLQLIGSANINGSGNAANNIVGGNSGNNKLYGVDGNDTLNGAEGNDYLDGGAGGDRLNGGVGNDVLVGGDGADTLTGEAGADRFGFNSQLQGIDTLTDFIPVDDTIVVSAGGFGGGLTPNAFIRAAQFVIGTAATNTTQRFIYNSGNGALFFDVDGSGAAVQTQIAALTGIPSLNNGDIFVFA